MQSINEQLLDNTISHQVELQGYQNHVAEKMVATLNRADRKLVSELEDALERLPPERFTVKRLERMLDEVMNLNQEVYALLEGSLKTELLDLVNFEAAYQQQLFAHVLPVELNVAGILPETVYTAAFSRPFQISKDGAVTLSQYLAGLSDHRAKLIRQSISLGYTLNEPIDKIVRTIRGTRAQNYVDGLLQAPRHHVEGMVRTAVNHFSNFTAQRFYKKNEAILNGWQFIATLDSKVTITCASLSNKVFPIGEGPIPPRHIRCRSFATPVVKSFRELGIDVDNIPASTRASMSGQVAADITFSDWLKSRPSSIQDEILGPTRARMFRANEITVDKFADTRGKVYTLDELRKRNKELFTKAGM